MTLNSEAGHHLVATMPAPPDPGPFRARGRHPASPARRAQRRGAGRVADIFTDPLGGHFH